MHNSSDSGDLFTLPSAQRGSAADEMANRGGGGERDSEGGGRGGLVVRNGGGKEGEREEWPREAMGYMNLGPSDELYGRRGGEGRGGQQTQQQQRGGGMYDGHGRGYGHAV